MTDRRLFYVTGMHRSGTSALTRAINLLGVSVGPVEDLMPPQADNPTGFWEVSAVARLNEEILASRGGSWRSRPPGSMAGSATGSAIWTGRITAIVDHLRESGPGPYVLKDPRFAWTMPLWASVAPPEMVIVAIRAPEQVCASLNRRNAIGQEDAAALWLDYVSEVMRADHRRIVVDYAHLLDIPDDTARGIAAALDLPEPSPATLQRIRAFLDPELDHSSLSPRELRGNNLDQARKAYESLAEESQSWRRLDARATRPQGAGSVARPRD